MPVMNKDLPEAKENNKKLPTKRALKKDIPDEAELDKEIPEASELDKEMPEASPLDKPQPPLVDPENIIRVGDQDIEIKPTKLLYQRNKTAAAYRILDVYPLPDILAMDKGILDPERDGDAIVFDFLTAVFDDGKLVAKYYDTMDSETIYRAVQIFKRLNHIDDKEEASKNRAAKGTSK